MVRSMKTSGYYKEITNEAIKYVVNRLEEWAEWFSRGNWHGLGYSAKTIIYHLMTEGAIIHSTSNVLPVHEAAEEIEALICEMQKEHDDLAYVVRIHYLAEGSQRQKSQLFNIHRDHLSERLHSAHYWLAGRLAKNTKKLRY